jgi:hypothetical protein
MVYSVVSYTVEVTGTFVVVGATVVAVVDFEVDALVVLAEEEKEEELVVGTEEGSSKQEQAELTLTGLPLQFSR